MPLAEINGTDLNELIRLAWRCRVARKPSESSAKHSANAASAEPAWNHHPSY